MEVKMELEKLRGYHNFRRARSLVHFVPGFNGSPAYLSRQEASHEFWKDQWYHKRALMDDLDISPSKIEVSIKNRSSRRKDETYIVTIPTDYKGLEKCQWCGGPALPESRCILCDNYPTTGEDPLETPPISFTRV